MGGGGGRDRRRTAVGALGWAFGPAVLKGREDGNASNTRGAGEGPHRRAPPRPTRHMHLPIMSEDRPCTSPFWGHTLCPCALPSTPPANTNRETRRNAQYTTEGAGGAECAPPPPPRSGPRAGPGHTTRSRLRIPFRGGGGRCGGGHGGTHSAGGGGGTAVRRAAKRSGNRRTGPRPAM